MALSGTLIATLMANGMTLDDIKKLPDYAGNVQPQTQVEQAGQRPEAPPVKKVDAADEWLKTRNIPEVARHTWRPTAAINSLLDLEKTHIAPMYGVRGNLIPSNAVSLHEELASYGYHGLVGSNYGIPPKAAMQRHEAITTGKGTYRDGFSWQSESPEYQAAAEQLRSLKSLVKMHRFAAIRGLIADRTNAVIEESIENQRREAVNAAYLASASNMAAVQELERLQDVKATLDIVDAPGAVNAD